MMQQVRLIAVLALFALVAAPGLAEAEEFSDRLALTEMLLGRDFAALDEELSRHQEAFESGATLERFVAHGFAMFDNSDPMVGEALDAWVGQAPGSYAARLARALYLAHLALLTYPTTASPDPLDQRYAPMAELARAARTEIERAIEINPRLTLAYASLIRLQLMLGDRNAVTPTRDAGLMQYPQSALIHMAFARSLSPAYGGSYEALWNYIHAAVFQDRNEPEIGAVVNIGEYFRGWEAMMRGDYAQAARHLGSTKPINEIRLYLVTHAYALVRAGKFGLARERAERSLDIWPQDPDAYYVLALALAALGDGDAALAASGMAVRLDPLRPEFLVVYSRQLGKLGRWGDALAHLENALVYGSRKEEVYALLGRAYLLGHDDAASAVAPLIRAVEYDPREPDSWLYLAKALQATGDCRYIRVISVYVEMCSSTGTCTPRERRVHEEDAKAFRTEHTCEG